MRNLKRALSLAMTSIMLLGLMVVGAGAASFDAFPDKDKVVNKDAVSMLTELNIISGKDDGNFDPEGIITRAEMAKLVCVVLNGGKDPQLGAVGNASYTDTVGNWASAYIEYCTNRGIVAGKGDGKFDPTATVTGSEAAKMLLVALGYSSEAEGFTGGNWEVNTNIMAGKGEANLYADLDSMNPSEGLTRDNAAQMVFNALNADEQYYNSAVTVNGVTIGNSQRESRKVTLLKDKFGVSTIKGVVLANEFAALNASSALAEKRTELNIASVDGDDTVHTFGGNVFHVTTGAEYLGRSVTIYASSLKDVSGSAILSSEDVVVTANKELSESAFKTLVTDAGLKVGSTVTRYDNYDNGHADTLDKDLTGYGKELTIIDNDADGEAEIVLSNIKNLSKVTTYSTKNENLKLAGVSAELSFKDDVKGYEDFAKDDMVMYQLVDGVYYLTEPTVTEGVMSSYVAGKTITVDGTAYHASVVPTASISDVTAFTVAGFIGESGVFDNTYKLYLDASDSIIAYEIVKEEAGNFAVVLASGVKAATIGTDYTGEAKLLYTDGTTATVNVNMKETAKKFDGKVMGTVTIDKDTMSTLAQVMANSSTQIANSKDAMKGNIVTFTESSGGVVLAPTDMVAAPTATTGNINKNSASIIMSSPAVTVVLNSSTIFMFEETDNSNKTYVANGVSNIGTTNIALSGNLKAVAYNDSSKVAQVVFLSGNGMKPGTSNATYAYVAADPSVRTVDGETHYFYTAYDEAGEKFTLETTSAIATTKAVVEYALDNKGIAEVTEGTADADGNLAIREYVKGFISRVQGDTIGVTYPSGGTYYFNAAKVPVYDISGDEVEETSFTVDQAITLSTRLDNGVYVIGTGFVTDQTVTSYAITLDGRSVGSFAQGATVTLSDLGLPATYSVVGGGAWTNQSNSSATFTMPANDIAITGTYTVAATVATVAGSGANSAGTYSNISVSPATAAYGSTVTVTVTPSVAVAANTDTVTVTMTAGGNPTTKTVTFVNSDGTTPKTVTFTMPSGNVEFTASVANA